MKFPKCTLGRPKRAFSATWYPTSPWLHYIHENDSVLCFYCATAVQRKLPLGGYVHKCVTETRFNNWKKAIKNIEKHERSACHHAAFDMMSKTSIAVDEMLRMHFICKGESQ